MTPDEFMKKAREIGGTPDAVSWQWADLYREAKATLGERTIKQITEAEDWPGPSYPVFKELGRVGKRFPPVVRSRYLDLLPLGFTKWQAVTSVKNDDTAVFLLTNALHFGWTVPKLRGERSRIL